MLVATLVVAIAAYASTLQPGSLTLNIGLCGDTACVSWVMPGGKAWSQGARPGMTVVSIDGRDLADSYLDIGPRIPVVEADLLSSTGKVVHVEVTENPIGRSPMKFSLWIVSGAFALLSAAVLLRRPDLQSAREFALFGGVSAIALAVGPSAGGPAPVWALIVQFLSLVGVGAFLSVFIFSLTQTATGSRWSAILHIFPSCGFIIACLYVASVVAVPPLYEIVRPMLALYVSGAAVGAVSLLALQGVRERSPLTREQARVMLFGTAVGMLPFVCLTFVPEAIGAGSLYPVHFTVLPLAFVPVSFAYGVLHHHLLGIRRLVHRGMVYGIATVVLLILVNLGLAVLMRFSEASIVPLSLSAMLFGGIVAFFLLRRGARWLVDILLYRADTDYRSILQVMQKDLRDVDHVPETAAGIVTHVAQTLDLESTLLFLGKDLTHSRLVARAGARTDYVLRNMPALLGSYAGHVAVADVTQVRCNSDSLLIAPLKSSGRNLGFLVLGPKEGGEVFIEEEKRLASTIKWVLAVAIEKGMLSEELGDLNRRLVAAQETERARMAADLHDGALQTALLIAAGPGRRTMNGSRKLAHQLVVELREFCSRLRPAILDDLGVVPALEWLLEREQKRSGMRVCLSMQNMIEEDRFSADIELALFRVAQEAITNVVKHAKATSIEVSLSREGDNLTLQVTDNGEGLPAEPYGRGGLGLYGMRERVTALNGSFNISSAPGLGTTVTVCVPVMREERDWEG